MDEEKIIKTLENHEARIKRIESLFERNADTLPVKEIWDIEGEKLTLLKFVGTGTQEKTKNIALLVLLGYKRKLNQNKVEASEIKRNVGLNGIPTENFAAHIKEMIPQLILRVGKIKSKKLAYRLTPFGEAKAKDVLDAC
jgi:hypothetical protein